MGPWYCTREDVKAALDAGDTSRSNAQIDRLIEAKSRGIEALCHRRFYPELGTRYFAWPNDQMGTSWRLWLDQHEILAVTGLTADTATITDYFLEPQGSGPPYDRIEIDLGGSDAFSSGATYQRAIAVTGTFGYTQDTARCGALAGGISASVTELAVTDASAIGVGSLLQIGAERMQVTARRMLATADTATLTASPGDRALAVVDGAAYSPGELLLVDTERMVVDDIAGDTLVVRRAWDGTTLAAHTAATVYAARTLAVTRAELGTTAATHAAAAPVLVHQVPGPVHALCVDEVVWALQNRQSGMARVIGSGEAARQVNASTLRLERDDVRVSHGRNARVRVV